MDFMWGRGQAQDPGRRRAKRAFSAEGTALMLLGRGKVRAVQGIRDWAGEKGSLSPKSLGLFGRNWGPPGGFKAAW